MPLVRCFWSFSMPMKTPTIERIITTSRATASTLMMERIGRCRMLAITSLFMGGRPPAASFSNASSFFSLAATSSSLDFGEAAASVLLHGETGDECPSQRAKPDPGIVGRIGRRMTHPGNGDPTLVLRRLMKQKELDDNFF